MLQDMTELERKFGLPSGLLNSVMLAESGGNPKAVSPKGARGLMQFMPETADAYGIDPMNPQEALVGAARMLADLQKQHGGDLDKTLAGYNWGSGNMAKYGMENMPSETRNYISKIKGNLEKQYANSGQIMNDAGAQDLDEEELMMLAQARRRRAEAETKNAAGSGIGVGTTAEIPQVDEEELTMIAEAKRRRAEAERKEQRDNSSFLGDMKENFKHGIQSGADLLSGNFEDIGNTQLTPKTQALGDKLFPKGSEGTFSEMLKQIPNTDISDWAGAAVEKFGNTPEAKALAVIGGTHPLFNAIGTGYSRYVAPAIEETTGIHPDNLAMLGLLSTPLGLKAAKGYKDPLIPAAKALAPVAKVAAYPILNPVKTAAEVVGTGAKLIAKPFVRPILENDNPITGSMGLKNAMETPVAKEGMRLAEKFGIEDLTTAGELTGQASFRNIEDALANSARHASKFADNNLKKTDILVNRFNNALDQVYKEPTSAESVGVNLSSAYNNTIKGLMKNRSEQAKIDFGEAYKGAKADGQYILSNNLFKTLQELKDEGSARLLTPAKAEGGSLARKLLGRLTDKSESGNEMASMITMEELGNGLSDFSAAARRAGGAFEDAKTAAQRRTYARLNDALLKDLDAEINNPKGDPTKAAMLSVARDNFKKFSNKISDVEKTTLGKMLGDSRRDSQGELIVTPEAVSKKMLTLQPTELKRTLSFLDENHPEVSNMTRRYIIEKAFTDSIEGKGLRGEGDTRAFPKAEFLSKLPDQRKLDALLGGSGAHKDITDIAAVMNRMIDWGAAQKGSQTAQRTDILNWLKKLPDSLIAKAIETDSMAEYLMNPIKRAKLKAEAIKVDKMMKDGQLQPNSIKRRFGAKNADE